MTVPGYGKHWGRHYPYQYNPVGPITVDPIPYWTGQINSPIFGSSSSSSHDVRLFHVHYVESEITIRSG